MISLGCHNWANAHVYEQNGGETEVTLLSGDNEIRVDNTRLEWEDVREQNLYIWGQRQRAFPVPAVKL